MNWVPAGEADQSRRAEQRTPSLGISCAYWMSSIKGPMNTEAALGARVQRPWGQIGWCPSQVLARPSSLVVLQSRCQWIANLHASGVALPRGAAFSYIPWVNAPTDVFPFSIHSYLWTPDSEVEFDPLEFDWLHRASVIKEENRRAALVLARLRRLTIKVGHHLVKGLDCALLTIRSLGRATLADRGSFAKRCVGRRSSVEAFATPSHGLLPSARRSARCGGSLTWRGKGLHLARRIMSSATCASFQRPVDRLCCLHA
jgi:hypothetical protein